MKQPTALWVLVCVACSLLGSAIGGYVARGLMMYAEQSVDIVMRAEGLGMWIGALLFFLISLIVVSYKEIADE